MQPAAPVSPGTSQTPTMLMDLPAARVAAACFTATSTTAWTGREKMSAMMLPLSRSSVLYTDDRGVRWGGLGILHSEVYLQYKSAALEAITNLSRLKPNGSVQAERTRTTQ
jgi:hypothetical protein